MVGTTQKQESKLSDKDLIKAVLNHWMEDGSAISLWRYPNSLKKNVLICTEGAKQVDDLSLEELEPGFIFTPFDIDKKKIYLKGNHLFEIERGKIVAISHGDADGIEFISSEISSTEKIKFHSVIHSTQDAGKNDYIRLVNESIRQIQNGSLEKIVPARDKKINLPDTFDILACFDKLCDSYPNAFVSLVSTSETGTWIGASPELLVTVNKEMKFKTAAVAGTQVLPDSADLKQIAWTQKEIEEQALVSRYIINCFKKIRLREFDEHGPKTWKAGNLLHLKTEFEVDMSATNFPQLGSVMLKLLHPTSAICGMPREESLQFLKKYENLDRKFYSGFLGPVNFQGETHVFVNLRCMHWMGKEAILYAGAGVTQDSVPEKEWDETEMKLNTLLNVIQS